MNNISNTDSPEMAVSKVVLGSCSEILLVLGVIGNILCIGVFRKQKDEVYSVQVALAVSELLTCVFYVASSIDVYFVPFDKNSFDESVMRNYAIMVYLTHLLYPTGNAFFNATVLLLLIACIDRAFALAKPIVYKQIPHNTKTMCFYVGIIICFVLGILTSLVDVFRKYVALQTSGVYFISVDVKFSASAMATGLNWCRTVLRLGAAVLVVLLNIAIFYMYHKLPSNSQEHKNYISLLIGQSVLILIGHAYLNVLFFWVYYVPLATVTYAFTVVRLICTPILYVAASCNFIVYIGVSRTFRKQFFQTFPALARVLRVKVAAETTPISKFKVASLKLAAVRKISKRKEVT